MVGDTMMGLLANSWGIKSIVAHSIEFTCGSPG